MTAPSQAESAQVYKNEMHLAGELAKAPELRFTSSGKKVANLTVVTKWQQHTEFHRVTAWDTAADKADELTKGDFVKVVCRLQTRSWDDKATRQKRYATEIVV